ncbi:hypothetical protein BRADI_1g28795v3 [Brachypodium distachyon]|uniref:Uncharacterized protein n=1 Tax=Brachypodium distachyon TaxID=15368 RepID=A0A2K2DLR4_BRADI|nr:hypothetical protein BRADI_1g28795v3 [Brachypodium distachyon]
MAAGPSPETQHPPLLARISCANISGVILCILMHLTNLIGFISTCFTKCAVVPSSSTSSDGFLDDELTAAAQIFRRWQAPRHRSGSDTVAERRWHGWTMWLIGCYFFFTFFFHLCRRHCSRRSLPLPESSPTAKLSTTQPSSLIQLLLLFAKSWKKHTAKALSKA